jgi:hypothetical protein
MERVPGLTEGSDTNQSKKKKKKKFFNGWMLSGLIFEGLIRANPDELLVTSFASLHTFRG